MKHTLLAVTALAGTIALAHAAEANNARVENALQSRPELSTFYSLLQATGVLNELSDTQSYTVFAPTNDAFAHIPAQQYPCFYGPGCRTQLTSILRRHIVPGEKHLDHKLDDGTPYSMFSIDNQHVTANELNKGTYSVDGQKVLNENQLLGGDLYELAGVMITEGELAQFTPPTVIVDQAPPAPPPAPQQPKVIITTHTDATTPQPF